MLENILGLKWVGALSLEDADVLAYYAKQSKSVLEYGTGGSTMLFAQLNERVVSIDTEQLWFDEMKKRMSLLSNKCNVEYIGLRYMPILNKTNDKFDLIFVDGEWRFRQQFAMDAWHLLSPGGSLIFHDTRKQQDMLIMCDVISHFSYYVEKVEFAVRASNGKLSNMSVITKRKEPITTSRFNYINLQSEEEHREMWTYGRMEDYNLSNGLYEYTGEKELNSIAITHGHPHSADDEWVSDYTK